METFWGRTLDVETFCATGKTFPQGGRRGNVLTWKRFRAPTRGNVAKRFTVKRCLGAQKRFTVGAFFPAQCFRRKRFHGKTFRRQNVSTLTWKRFAKRRHVETFDVETFVGNAAPWKRL